MEISSVEIQETEYSDEFSICTVTLDGRYEILTTTTTSSATVDDWIQSIYAIHQRHLHHLLVGLDVEWRPAFGRYSNPVAVLQLCVGRRCLIFQIRHADGVPNSLYGFLSDSRFTFLGVGIDEDALKLEEDHGIPVSGGRLDLRGWAAERMGREELRRAGLKALARAVMGIEVNKPRRVQMGRWDNPVLNWDQIKYACIDAFLSFEIGRMLHNNEWTE